MFYEEYLDAQVELCGGTEKRKIVTKMIWNVLSNRFWYDSKIFEKQNAENFAEMFKLEDDNDDTFVNEYNVHQLLKFIFNPNANITEDFNKVSIKENKLISKIRSNLIDRNFSTEIFIRKRFHKALKKILENDLNFNGRVCIINGETTSNEEAERYANQFLKENDNKPVIFIADTVGIRSFSVKEIKNIVLLIDGSEYGTLLQRISRGLTENVECDVCNIVDFRTTTNINGCSGIFVCGHAERKNKENAAAIKTIIDNMDIDSIVINEYFNNGVFDANPMKQMSTEEIRSIIASGNFTKKAIVDIFSNENSDLMIDLKKIVSNIDCSDYKDKKPEKIILDILNTENNVHGKKTKNVSVDLNKNSEKNTKERTLTDKEKAINYHLAWFANHFVEVFRMGNKIYNEHIIYNTYKDIIHSTVAKKWLINSFNLNIHILNPIIKHIDKLFYDLTDMKIIESMKL